MVGDLFEFKTPNGKLYARNIKNIESKRISNTYPYVVRQMKLHLFLVSFRFLDISLALNHL